MNRLLEWLRRLGTSARLSLQFSLLYAVLSAFVFLGAYWSTRAEVKDWVFEQMTGETETLSAIYETDGLESLQSSIETLANVSFENARIYQLRDAGGDILAGNILTDLPDGIDTFLSAASFELKAPNDDEVSSYWMREDRIGPYRLVQGSGDNVVEEVLEAVGTTLAVGYLAVVGLGFLLGVRVGRTTEERIVEISNTLALASQGDLDVRLAPYPHGDDDLSRIATGINAALDQLKRLFESQEQISNDIAHDLRTPLQRLRQRLEKMRESKVASEEDLKRASQQVEDIVATFNALLRIAQIEAQDRTARFDDVPLIEIVENVVDLFEPAAEDAMQSLTVLPMPSVAQIKGDASLLTQLFANLVENAILHCPLGATIELAIDDTGDQVSVSVADDGPGIPLESRQRVFERFVRIDTSRNSSGNGLGLTLAKAIAEMHGALILIEDCAPGVKFVVTFDR